MTAYRQDSKSGKYARLRRTIGFLITAVAVLSGEAAAEPASAEQDLKNVEGSLTEVDGIRQHASEEEPRVLHIVPWQAPSGWERERKLPSIPPRGSAFQPLGLDTLRVYREFRVIGDDRVSPPPS